MRRLSVNILRGVSLCLYPNIECVSLITMCRFRYSGGLPLRKQTLHRRGFIKELASAMRSSFLFSAFFVLSLLVAQVAGAQDFSQSYTQLISKGTFSGAGYPDGSSIKARMSKNGRFIVFESKAKNLVDYVPAAKQYAGTSQVFLYDRQVTQSA